MDTDSKIDEVEDFLTLFRALWFLFINCWEVAEKQIHDGMSVFKLGFRVT